MSQEVAMDREGVVRAKIFEYCIYKTKPKENEISESTAIRVRAKILEFYENEEWTDWSAFDVVVEGDLWIVKKNGELNTSTIESLVKYCDWDGTSDSVINGTWNATVCQCTIKLDDYKNQKRFKISYINDVNANPDRSNRGASAEEVQQFQFKYGSKLRAIVGQMKRNEPPQGGSKPPAPPQSNKHVSSKSQADIADINSELANEVVDENIPY